MTEKPLEGVYLNCPPTGSVPNYLIGTRRGEVWQTTIDAYKNSIALGSSLGASVRAVPDQSAYLEAIAEDDPHTFFLYEGEWSATDAVRKLDEAFFSTPEGMTIARPFTTPLGKCDRNKLFEQLDKNNPFMISYGYANNGHAKYFIEDPLQLEKLLHFIENNPQDNWPERLDYREYIESPSDRFTSYRGVVTPNGLILAAGLLVSSQTKQSGQIIEYDRIEQTDGALRCLKQAMESPDNRLRDVRSNISTGGYCIPLMGPNALLPLREVDERIVAAHGIDPHNRQVPESVRHIFKTMGEKCIPALDAATGYDVIAENGTLKPSYLERNLNPAGGTYTACGFSPDPLSALNDQRREALLTVHLDTRTNMERYMGKCPAYDPDKLTWIPASDGDSAVQVANLPLGWKLLKVRGKEMHISSRVWEGLMHDIRQGEFDLKI